MKTNRKVVATIEARMTSSRLPGKVLMECCGKPILQHMIERVRRCSRIDDIVVATTVNESDDSIVNLCSDIGCKYYRGDEDDVLERVLLTAQSVDADIIVELTGDCPFIDWRHIDRLVDIYLTNEYDFVANNIERSFPMGFDIRLFSTQMLHWLNENSSNPLDHEHVSIYFPKHPEKYQCYNWKASKEENRPELEVTLDEMGDYMLINAIFNSLYYKNNDFTCLDVIKYIDENTSILNYVKDVKRTVLN